MEWIMDPTIWAGLATLIVLEIVLGIDNLVFIAILADKLPAEKRDKARIIGLSLALIMRIILLMFTGWLVTLTDPLFSVAGISFNARQVIMLIGGLFLLFKATMELNERLEGQAHQNKGQKKTSHFGAVILQIVVLDAVFSLDSVITAVGMVDNIGVMIAAVIIAMLLMIFASKPLTSFVNAHPTIVILCLSFLLMIGFSLVAEGFGFSIPKGYLYAAIGFSILIEFFNQLSNFNRQRFLNSKPLRQRTADAILHLLRSNIEVTEADDFTAKTKANERPTEEQETAFNPQELVIFERVLGFAQRTVSSIMTSRHDIKMLNLNQDKQVLLQDLTSNNHTRLIVSGDDSVDEPLGIVNVNDLLKQLLTEQQISLETLIKQPLIFLESITLIVALEQFRKSKTHFAFVVDEFGSMQGVVSLTDIMETIAGEMPSEEDEIEEVAIAVTGENSWQANGYIPLDELTRTIPITLDKKREYSTLAGLLMEQTQNIPVVGDIITITPYQFEILEMAGHRIVSVKITRHVSGKHDLLDDMGRD